MKTALFAITVVVFLSARAGATEFTRTVADPVADYKTRHQSDLRAADEVGERVVKIQCDVDNDGRRDVLLSCEKSCVYDDKQYKNRVQMWDLYKLLPDGSYALVDDQRFGMNDGSHHILKGQVDFDPARYYVGYIASVNAFGLLAVHFLPKHNEVVLSVYVVRAGYLERLNYPDPNAPVEKYHRNDDGVIVDLPESARPYFAAPPKEKLEVVP